MSNYLENSKKYKGYHYRDLKPEMLEYLHKRSIQMLKVVVSILKQNEINYMICGGTLLGAVTTGKFIPWDDDVDVCVFEEDYDRMVNVLLRELPEDMIFQCEKTEKNYYHAWGKVRDKKSKTLPGEPLYEDNGVWIDIYKLIPMQAKEISLNRTVEHIEYLRRRFRVGGITRNEYWHRIIKEKLPIKLLIAMIRKKISPDRNRVYVLNSASGIVLDRSWCRTIKEYEFEGITVTSFYRGEEYLRRHYGDRYWLLPPEESRRVSIQALIANADSSNGMYHQSVL